MGLAGQSAELGEFEMLLQRAAEGFGGMVTLVGAAGSGKTALVAAAADMARDRGFEVLGASPARGQPGRLVWAQLLHDAGADEEARALLDSAGLLDTSVAVRRLTAGVRRLIVVDDVDLGGQDAVEVLGLVAAQLVTGSTAVVATASTPLGVGREITLCGLAEEELTVAVGGMPPGQGYAVWVASRGMPGIARTLAGQLADLPAGRDPLVHLALHAVPRSEFLTVDEDLVRLLEQGLARADDDAVRARLLAQLSRELLGDPLARPRRRALADEALVLARRSEDGLTLAEVLDARLHALWDPAGAEDRLAAASEITQLARAAGDERRARSGLFWRFVTLMELARVDEAEMALAAFERAGAAAGDAEASVMALSRHAMLDTLRGRFAAAGSLTGQVADQARRIALPDGARLVAALRGALTAEQGDEASWEAGVAMLYGVAGRLPGHLYEATAARILAALGRRSEAAAELGRLLPQVMAASGPRWLGAVTDLSAIAAEVGDTAAATQLLLAAPRRDIPSLDLAADGPGLRPAAAAPVLDAAAVASYRHRLGALEAELDDADAAGDAGRSARAEAERDWLRGDLRTASGLGRRMRRTTAESERARVNVTRALRAALDRITVAAPKAGAHLQASIRTGLACRYDPVPGGPARWHVTANESFMLDERLSVETTEEASHDTTDHRP